MMLHTVLEISKWMFIITRLAPALVIIGAASVWMAWVEYRVVARVVRFNRNAKQKPV
jgi:hypothetical protein